MLCFPYVQRFHAVVAVSDLNQNYSFSFSEIVDNEVATLRVDEEEVLCEYNRFTGYGRRIRGDPFFSPYSLTPCTSFMTGISCEESTNLPMGCSNKAFVPVADIFYAVGSSDRNFTSFRVRQFCVLLLIVAIMMIMMTCTGRRGNDFPKMESSSPRVRGGCTFCQVLARPPTLFHQVAGSQQW